MGFDLANTSSGFELPNAHRVIIGRGEKIFAIWMENKGSNPVIVTDLRRLLTAKHRMTIDTQLTRVCKHWPRSASQIFIVLSREAVAAYEMFALSGTPL